ncbi:hypothetical protein P7C73_g3470, partial [Tremellales sp. Uapishka_1]
MNDMEEGDNRTRNAIAQRRHREKRKVHVQNLEDSVRSLQIQLDDARRQLSAAASSRSYPYNISSPQSADVPQLEAENSYLRGANDDLRRELYAYRVQYGPLGGGVQEGEKDQRSHDLKHENTSNFGGVSYGQSLANSPQRLPGNRTNSSGPIESLASSNGESSSSSSFPPPLDHYEVPSRSSRGRLQTSSSVCSIDLVALRVDAPFPHRSPLALALALGRAISEHAIRALPTTPSTARPAENTHLFPSIATRSSGLPRHRERYRQLAALGSRFWSTPLFQLELNALQHRILEWPS